MHSYASDTTDEAKVFHEGIRLFNEGDWFEAHEIWEDIWHMASGPRKKFYQGLIQCAVTIEHVRRGNPRGVRSVWETAQAKFVDLPDIYMGVDVRKLLTEIETLIRPILELPPPWFDPARGKGLDLPVDLAGAPAIILTLDPFANGASTS